MKATPWIFVAMGMLFLVGCQRTREASDQQRPKNSPSRTPSQDRASITDNTGEIGASPEKARSLITKDTLTFEFQRFVVRPGRKDRSAEFLVANGYAKDIKGVGLTLEYLDEAGHKVGSFPWGAGRTGRPLCKAGGTTTMVAGALIPDKADKVRVVVEEITFTDGTNLNFDKHGLEGASK